jgi:hypothetical protein
MVPDEQAIVAALGYKPLPTYLDVSILANEQVLRFEVPVHQVPLMQVLQRKHHRRHVEARVGLRQGCTPGLNSATHDSKL